MWTPPITCAQSWPMVPGYVVPTGTYSSHNASLPWGTPRPSFVLQMPPRILDKDLKETRSSFSISVSTDLVQVLSPALRCYGVPNYSLFPLACVASVLPRAPWSHPIPRGAKESLHTRYTGSCPTHWQAQDFFCHSGKHTPCTPPTHTPGCRWAPGFRCTLWKSFVHFVFCVATCL